MALSNDMLLTLGLYVGLGGLYLVVVPLILLFYLKGRWHHAGSVERTPLVWSGIVPFFPRHAGVSPIPQIFGPSLAR